MKQRRIIVWIVSIVLVTGIAAGAIFISNKRVAPPAHKQTTSAQQVTTLDVKYLTPAGWAKLSATELSSEGASTGIATTKTPPAKFTIAIEPAASSPQTMTALRSLTLAGLERLTNYSAVSEKPTQVNGETAEQFIYTFGTTDKTEQQLLVTLHGGRAFSLLFTVGQKDFQSEASDLKTILDSFTFK